MHFDVVGRGRQKEELARDAINARTATDETYVHLKVFNIYSLTRKLLCLYFMSYLICRHLGNNVGCHEVYWMCLFIRGAMPTGGVCAVLPFKLLGLKTVESP